MNEDILDVLMFLLENGMMDDVDPDQDSLTATLSEAGFHNREITRAFDWLESLSAHFDAVPANTSRPSNGVRVYTDEEFEKLGLDGIGFLSHLENRGILGSETRELVIERILALEASYTDTDDIKWVTLFVLMNLHGRDFNSNEMLEAIIFGEDDALVH